jgi:hypothetical protein
MAPCSKRRTPKMESSSPSRSLENQARGISVVCAVDRMLRWEKAVAGLKLCTGARLLSLHAAARRSLLIGGSSSAAVL